MTTMRYLIVGLGNLGAAYRRTRHNIGFRVVDRLAEQLGLTFQERTLAEVAKGRHEGVELLLVKPTTYMNQSGAAVQHWLKKTATPLSHCLVVMDDLHLPFATLRIRLSGGAGGHNGLKSIHAVVGSQDYPRLRIGIGDHFPLGGQADYVLSPFSLDEEGAMPALLDRATQAVTAFYTGKKTVLLAPLAPDSTPTY